MRVKNEHIKLARQGKESEIPEAIRDEAVKRAGTLKESKPVKPKKEEQSVE